MAPASNDDREFGNLIGSDKVEGTVVYGAESKKIGTIKRVMIDKSSGKVSYAVLCFGGFLGIGDDYYPLPWHSLKYDTKLGGYIAGMTVDRIKGAPKYASESSWDWGAPGTTKSIEDYYAAIPWQKVPGVHAGDFS